MTGLITSCGGKINNGLLMVAVAELSPLTGTAVNAHSLYAGARLAAEQVNNAGGVNGYIVQVIPYADNNDPLMARQNAQAIAESKAVAVIGHSSSETTRTAAPIYLNTGMPAINASPVSRETILEFPNYFNISYTSEQQGLTSLITRNEAWATIMPRSFMQVMHLQVHWLKNLKIRFMAWAAPSYFLRN